MQLVIHKNNRIDSLDALRGVAILAMVFYHTLYDICDIFGINLPCFAFFTLLEPPFAGLFILLAGASSRFSHNNIKRGLRVLVFGLIVTAVTVIFIPSQSIFFGILHFMGVAILLFELVKRASDRIPSVPALLIFAFLFAVTYKMPETHMLGVPGVCAAMLPQSLFNTPYLFPLGFPGENFFSADYFPMIPWFFIFLIGTVLGVPIKNHRLPEKFYTVRIPVLASAGRNTLLIYVLHQPIIYGILSLVFYVFHVK